MKTKNIGIDAPAPQASCSDKNCPFHGHVRVRGRQFIGKVTSDRMTKSVTVQWERRKYWPKYERFETLYTSVKAHNPTCLNARTNQIVRIMETRPLSKTKNFTVVQVLGEQHTVTGEDMTYKADALNSEDKLRHVKKEEKKAKKDTKEEMPKDKKKKNEE
ncbi:MAG TPA: 30S ribosomal protein S17 [Candidatus Nanoarchaeia archaeon]|nr:30S ribosomal protein S17 [Candidatus Nanoarchaeia archaeon]